MSKIKTLSYLLGLSFAVYSVSSLAVGDSPASVNITNDLVNVVPSTQASTLFVCTFYPGNNLAYDCSSYPGNQIPTSMTCPQETGNFGSGYAPFLQCQGLNKSGTTAISVATDSTCTTTDNTNYSCSNASFQKSSPPK
jgi:hypothetical protein